MKLFRTTISLILAFAAENVHAVPFVFSASGASAASIQATVDAFRASLGTLNANLSSDRKRRDKIQSA